MQRNVYIRHEPNHHAFLVIYADRKQRTRKVHAQFDDRAKSMDDVIAYVRSNQVLRLVCIIGGNSI